MRRKFETNVAQEMPKTRAFEPELPWKLKNKDLGYIGLAEDEYKKGASPLRTRGIFLIILVLAIFVVISYLAIIIIAENENIRANMLQKEKEASVVKVELEKTIDEKKSLSENAAQLEKKVNDLSAQKELFTSVIETLTKKADDIEIKNSEETAVDKKEKQKDFTGKSQ